MASKPYHIGYTTGVFDLFHVGHLNILRRAKELCDILIVGVSTDELVLQYKHKKPIIPFDERIEIIKACRYVDKVVVQSDLNKIAAFQQLHFDVMFHGDDWKQSALFREAEQYLKSHGAEVVYFPYTSNTSTSILKARILQNASIYEVDRTAESGL